MAPKKYAKLEGFLQAALKTANSTVKNAQLSPAEKNDRMRKILKMTLDNFEKFPHIKAVYDYRVQKGENRWDAIRYINKHFDEVSDMRKNNRRENNQFAHIGRPLKPEDEKAQKNYEKVERYKTYAAMKRANTKSFDEIKGYQFVDIKRLKTKEAQEIANSLRVLLRDRIYKLKKAGFSNEVSVRTFEKYGGFINIKTASLNQLKSFIRRGVGFLKMETSTPAGVRAVRQKVVESVSKNVAGKVIEGDHPAVLPETERTGTHTINLKPYTASGLSYDQFKLFFDTVNELKDIGVGSIANSEEKYKLWDVADYFLRGGILDDEMFNDMMNAWMDEHMMSLDKRTNARAELTEFLNRHRR